jgi:hypothetical protein
MRRARRESLYHHQPDLSPSQTFGRALRHYGVQFARIWRSGGRGARFDSPPFGPGRPTETIDPGARPACPSPAGRRLASAAPASSISSKSTCLRFGKGLRRSLAKASVTVATASGTIGRTSTHVGGFVILSYDTGSAGGLN